MDVSTAMALLEQESAGLDECVAGLSPEQLTLETPSVGWTIADQIAHLHWTDIASVHAVTGDPAFDALVSRVMSGDEPNLVDDEAHRLADRPASELLADWRAGRQRLRDALADADPEAPIAWFGPPMRPITMITARVMETWAHGLDIFDALGIAKPAGPPLAAVARIGVRTRGFSFKSRGLEAPDVDVRVELSMPDGTSLDFGSEAAADRFTGTAWAFAAVVTQRRHPNDVELRAHGPVAEAWLDVAQAFAGMPTRGPDEGRRVVGGRR